MQQRIDVTTTAVLRPELLDKTFSSFKRLLFKDHPLRLIINVDRVGSETATVDDVIAIACKYFREVVPLTQLVPNQNTALKAVWSRVETDLFFNLEDDWELLTELDLLDMISIMRERPKLAALRLPQNRSVGDKCKVYHVCKTLSYFEWNGRYYQPPKDQVGFFGGVPSLIRTKWAQGIIPLISAECAVEKMCRSFAKFGSPLSRAWDWGCYTKPDTFRTVVERGKAWRRKHGFSQDSHFYPSGWVKRDAAAAR